jgi:glycerol-3-phosphate dehydrogenase (NAD(P)+)
MQVSVLGAGSWGTTVAALLARRHAVTIWARDEQVVEQICGEHVNERYLPGLPLPPQLTATSDLDEAVGSADLLVVGIPSHGFRGVLAQARPVLRPWIPVVSLTKGLEQGSLLRMTEVAKQELPGHPIAALTGPNIAREIASGQAAAAVIATPDLDVAAALQQVLQRGLFRIYTNHDVIGCELGGALKNVVAIATGIAQGLGVGDNTRALVMTRGLAELTQLGVAMGGEAVTMAGLTGMGDLLATCISPHSRNRRLGEELGKGRSLQDVLAESTQVVEGVRTAAAVHELAGRHGLQMPICEAIHQVLSGQIPAVDAYSGLRTTAGHESEPG